MSDKYLRRDEKKHKQRYGMSIDNKSLKQIQLDLYYRKLEEKRESEARRQHVTTETTDEEVN